MFRCAYNKELSMPGERPVTLVIEQREKEYVHAHKEEKSYGWEVVKEIKVREVNLEKAKKKYGLT